MRNFNVYVDSQNNYEAVKQGWSWPGFFFVMIWAFVKKLWVPACIVLALSIICGLISAMADYQTASAISGLSNLAGLVCSIIFGANGNQWREKNLVSKGYKLAGTVQAGSPEEAISDVMEGKTENTPVIDEPVNS